jgi:hypothetical protein
MKKLIFIGNKFYDESDTMMSSVYQIIGKGKYQRSDWGWIQTALENRVSISIRPATKKEMAYFELRLNEYRKETLCP